MSTNQQHNSLDNLATPILGDEAQPAPLVQVSCTYATVQTQVRTMSRLSQVRV